MLKGEKRSVLHLWFDFFEKTLFFITSRIVWNVTIL